MFDAIIGAFSGIQYCSGNCPVCKSWSNVHTPMLPPGCNCPFVLAASMLVSAFCTAGKHRFMSDDVSKMSRKRLSTFGAAGCARAAGTKKNPASSTAKMNGRWTI